VRRAIALLVLVIAGRADAQSAELTREFQAGVDAFRLGKYAEARTHLERAERLDPKLPGPHRFLGAVARVEQKWDECIAETRRAIALNPRSTEIAETRRLHDACRELAGRPSYRGELGDSAAISVTTNVPGATVKINKLAFGVTPLAPRTITAGTLTIDVEKQGWRPAHAEVDALPGIVSDAVLDLEPEPEGQTVTETPHAVAPTMGWIVAPPDAFVFVDGKPASGKVELAPGTHEVELRQPSKEPWRRRIRIVAGVEAPLHPEFVDSDAREATERTGVWLVGGAGAVAAFGFVAMLISSSANADAREIERVEKARPQPIDTSVEPLHTRADWQAARDRADRWSLYSNVAYAAALATAGVGAIFLWRGGKPRGDDLPPFAVVPLHGGAIVTSEVAW
jgi:PEGA domain-containing protein